MGLGASERLDKWTVGKYLIAYEFDTQFSCNSIQMYRYTLKHQRQIWMCSTLDHSEIWLRANRIIYHGARYL